MIFIQSYWWQLILFPIMCYTTTIHHSLKIKNLCCMDNPTYPMGDFFWDNLWRKTESNPKFYVGKVVHVVANFVKLGRQCPWTRGVCVCVWARTCTRLNIFSIFFFGGCFEIIYLFIFPCFEQSKPLQNHFIFNFLYEISPLKIKKKAGSTHFPT
jgi:hypothetical protein